jgi:large subunit ribosomal protein L13
MSTNKSWHLVDAQNQPLGRLATQIASLLMGKHSPNFTRHQDLGNYVVVVNAGKIKFTGNKRQQKTYNRYSGYPGGLKTLTLEQVQTRNPAFPLRHAVSGMLPKNKLKSRMIKRLKIFPGPDHPYQDKFQNS